MKMKKELTEEVVKALPPTAISAMTIFGVGLQDWVYLLTIVYLIAQIVLVVRKWVKKDKDED